MLMASSVQTLVADLTWPATDSPPGAVALALLPEEPAVSDLRSRAGAPTRQLPPRGGICSRATRGEAQAPR